MKEKNNKQDNSNIKWALQAFVLTFILSGAVSFISNNGIEKLNIFASIIILIAVILIGIVFDIIGVAVTVAEEGHFHAKATKKAKGAKTSLKLIKNIGAKLSKLQVAPFYLCKTDIVKADTNHFIDIRPYCVGSIIFHCSFLFFIL